MFIKHKRTLITRIDGRHLLAPVETFGVITGVAAVARFPEQERDPALAEHADVEDEQCLQQIHDDMAIYQGVVLEPREQKREPAGAHDRIEKDEHPEAVLHFVMDTAVRAHPLDPVRGRQYQAQIDHDGERDTHEHHGKPQPTYGFLGRIGRTAHGGFIRLKGEMREDRRACYADRYTPNPGRVVAVLPAVGHPQENVARSERVPHVVAQGAEPEEGGHQENVHDRVWKKKGRK